MLWLNSSTVLNQSLFFSIENPSNEKEKYEIHILRKLKNRSLKYRAIREIKALLKICAMALKWTLKKVCKDTPVLVANKNYNSSDNPFKISNAKSLAVAAAMPIVAVPIQEVQLLDYAVAHETVNSTYGLTASTDDDIYLGLLDKDPYTSDQQRERDEYEINDTDWNEVVFEEVNGGSTAKLALHIHWIEKQSYEIDAVVNLDLPEMGISGPFRITSIKHILPQKKPADDDEADDYDYKPVTGLFIHEASDVWKIKFDNGEELGVTHNHPIYSTTIGDWQFAGMLSIGEEVLTKDGGAKVVSKKIDQSQQVYNLEIKDYHNFLVNESGIVVHNNGLCSFLKSLFTKYSKWHKAEPDWGLNDSFVDEVMVKMVNDPTSIQAVTTVTHNGKTYLIEGHHRLRAAKRLKTEQGVDFELNHMDIHPDHIGTVTPYNNIDEFIQNTFLPDE